MHFIDLDAQLKSMRTQIDKRIADVLDHGQFIMGPEVAELEQKLSKYVGVKHCISCANGTDALQLSLMALDIGPGDTVITTAFSFFATAEVIPLVGATPYFVDINPSTYNICPEALQAGIHNARKQGLKPKAVIAVDMFGLPANFPEIQAICDKEGLYLIEDAAQGFGGSIDAKRAGSFGDIATTSFFPAKPLGCYGDGGAIFTNSNELASLCESLRVHGKGEHKYQNVRIGLNSRLDTIQAAILLEKLEHFPQELTQRQHAAKHYATSLSAILNIPNVPEGYQSSWAQYTVTHKKDKRVDWMSALKQAGIPTAIYYPVGLNKQLALQHYPSDPTSITERLCDQVFSLPMHGYLESDSQQTIIEKILGL